MDLSKEEEEKSTKTCEGIENLFFFFLFRFRFYLWNSQHAYMLQYLTGA